MIQAPILIPATIDRLTPSGLGVAIVGGRRTRVAHALPGEQVEFYYVRRHRGGDDGIALTIANSHPDRVTPVCPHTERCGGCTMQHMHHQAQIRLHQTYLEECLAAVGQPQHWLAPITAAAIHGYRRKARLGVKFVDKLDTVMVGFRERGRSLVTAINCCTVLHPAVGLRIADLRALIATLEGRRVIPQIEVAVGDAEVALILRHTAPLSEGDRASLITFAVSCNALCSADHTPQLQILLQSGGLDTITPLWPATASLLTYRLPKYDITLTFRPTDFVQVNAAVNQAMIDQALDLLEPQVDEAILDLYCGLGNFTLPVARRGARVIGIEGDAGLVERACHNARHNNLVAEFLVHDLTRGLPLDALRRLNPRNCSYTKALLDPPRSGAASVLPNLVALGVTRLLYVSCNPATLSHDAVELVQRYGYHLESAGVIDMFPHTGHMESMALFRA